MRESKGTRRHPNRFPYMYSLDMKESIDDIVDIVDRE